MKPLFVLLGVFAVALLVGQFTFGEWMFSYAGRVAMAAMLLFTAIGHFAFTKGMAMMLPEQIPYKTALVYLTGVFEILAAAGLLFQATKEITGLALVLFFIAILPANINAAVKNVDYQKANAQGYGPGYLWLRIPMQVFFIIWVYYFTA